jgi:hypothetical protein
VAIAPCGMMGSIWRCELSDEVPTRNDMIQIIRINAYIQRGMGKVMLDGEEIIVIALDRSWAGTNSYDPERFLTDEQLNDLFIQSYGYTKNP